MSGIAGQTTEALAVHLIRTGQWREAVQLIREDSGLNLPQAEATIERLAVTHGVPRRPQNRVIVVAILSCISLLGIAWFFQWSQLFY